MKRYFIHNGLFRVLAPAVYGVLVYLLILLINNDVVRVNELFISEEVYVCIGLCYIVFEFIRLQIVLLDRFLGKKFKSLRIPLQFVGTSALAVVAVLICLRL